MFSVVIDGNPAVLGVLAGALAQGMSGRLTQSVTDLQAYIVANKLSGSPLRLRSGALRASISSEIGSVGQSTYTGTIGTSVSYARIQEFGGTIAHRRAEFLMIPLAAALNGQGLASYGAAELIADPRLGGFIGTFFRRNILFGRSAAGSTLPLFKLQPTVELPKRSFFGSALEDKQSEILAAFRSDLQQEL